ncbi:DUF397 domain-containing protein [Streptomyces sp. NPDC018029]|uniref:DUF397 domain-containing protein n=1 Tax=Streptomyces sp. NPDC018029 TaxID=3365032 RepID=UPI0037B82297
MPAVTPFSPSALTWFKSSYSGGNTTECVEAAFLAGGVLIRDSKQADGPRLLVSSAAWVQFLTGAAERL